MSVHTNKWDEKNLMDQIFYFLYLSSRASDLKKCIIPLNMGDMRKYFETWWEGLHGIDNFQEKALQDQDTRVSQQDQDINVDLQD